MIVTQYHLHIANECSAVEGVRGERVSQAMWRKSFKVVRMRCLFNGPLDIGFVATPAHR